MKEEREKKKIPPPKDILECSFACTRAPNFHSSHCDVDPKPMEIWRQPVANLCVVCCCCVSNDHQSFSRYGTQDTLLAAGLKNFVLFVQKETMSQSVSLLGDSSSTNRTPNRSLSLYLPVAAAASAALVTVLESFIFITITIIIHK